MKIPSDHSLPPFARRHIGPSAGDVDQMLQSIGFDTVGAMIEATVPADIRLDRAPELPEPVDEVEALGELRAMMGRNRVLRSFIGLGYHGTVTPAVIQRNILENPGWYTAYTPYQAEISQGRLEALLNFQTVICELTGMDVANASLLDEPTAAAEAIHLAHDAGGGTGTAVFVSDQCLPQTVDVVRTRMGALGIEVMTGSHQTFEFGGGRDVFAVLVAYPARSGEVFDYEAFAGAAHAHGATVIVSADPLALVLLRPPGEFGADVCIGSAQRFGVPLGFGGPHAAYMGVREPLKRKLPGRLVGVSVDAHGGRALRLSLQTREQHIRREKATSNICTAQVLLAVMAGMYAVWHGPDGLRAIASRILGLITAFRNRLAASGFGTTNATWFDTLTIKCPGRAGTLLAAALEQGINLRKVDADHVAVSFDETVQPRDLAALAGVFGLGDEGNAFTGEPDLPLRKDRILEQPVFNRYHSEHEMLRYLHRLETKDVALDTSMIALGSCTMKLNAASEMMPLGWPEVGAMHPLAPRDQAAGYLEMFGQLERWLAAITGFAAVSLQPNAGSQGEYAGLLAIRGWHRSRGEPQRDVCLIPVSAHGTNPASAAMAGFTVIPVKCDAGGNIDLSDLGMQAERHAERLGALMVTYPSTHGVFEEGIREVCAVIHAHGGQVYMDGANMNAQVGLTSPATIGADVCHLNLHKTFCIPHGGGGPGVGPVCVAAHLTRFLPAQSGAPSDGGVGPVAGAPWGSASIDTIPWMYIRMMGAPGLKAATEHAILNANYVARRLAAIFPTLYTGRNGTVAHECILDLRPFQSSAGVTVEDVAKRLMDYGFHAPTMSWPVPGTLMVEPTESESKAELDRFCDAMTAIHGEIRAIESGEADRLDNALKNAPHTARAVCADDWRRGYSRERAAFPAPWLRDHKYWPPVGRIDNAFGDRNLVCTCPAVEDFESSGGAGGPVRR